MPSTHARQIAWLIRHPEACVHAVQAARSIPLADLATLERSDPPSIRVLLDGRLETLQPDLAWFIRFGPSRQRGLLLVDAVQRFDPASIGAWPRLRAGIRLQIRCPTWMIVHAPRHRVVAAIEAGFVHQRELMPILMGPDHPRADLGQAPHWLADVGIERDVFFPRPRLLTP
jgi:hypothetical protein